MFVFASEPLSFILLAGVALTFLTFNLMNIFQRYRLLLHMQPTLYSSEKHCHSSADSVNNDVI